MPNDNKSLDIKKLSFEISVLLYKTVHQIVQVCQNEEGGKACERKKKTEVNYNM